MEGMKESPRRLMASLELRMRKLGALGPAVGGTLCERPGKCQNPECPCHQGARMHFSYQLTRADHGRTRTVSVPRSMVKVVRQWVANHREARRLLQEATELAERYIRAAVPCARAAAAREREARRG